MSGSEDSKEVVLITGARGYLAGRMAACFAATGRYRVRLTTHSENLTLPAGLQAGSAEVVKAELASLASLESVCQGVAHVVHLASVNETACFHDPAGAYAVNTGGTVNLVRAAENAGVRRFVYFSTAHVYGRPLAGLISETSATRPADVYSGSHKAAEDFLFYGRRTRAMEAIVLRLSNGTGYPVEASVQRWTLLANDLCRQAVERGFVELKSAGLQFRDFVTLADASRAAVHAVEMPADLIGDGLFNLGGNASMSVMQMARLIAAQAGKVLGRPVEIVAPAAAPGETAPELTYSIEKLESTGFRLTGSLEEEIQETLRLCQASFSPTSSAPGDRVA